ncbi:MFS transporter [Candidatus Pristimantibacillus sp. PTI5]|uniref:MFS transporter n=1 Tax=Candidatus Pristimantibacillus sp. PTI5 TaxID=3400422 RepID=UPI003B01FD47
MRLSTIIAIAFSFQLMMNLTRPLVTLYGISLGADAIGIGMITAAYALFPLLLAIPIGKVADIIGDRSPVRIGVAGMMAGTALPFIFPDIWALYVSQALVGVSHIFISISLQNLIGNMSNSQNRDHHFGLFSMAVALSGIVGPVAGGMLADYSSYGFAFGMASVAGLVPMAFAMLLPDSAKPAGQAGIEAEKGSALELLRIPLLRKALASSALVLYSRDVFVAYFPLFASDWGMSASTIGWIIGVQGLTMVLVRLFLARLTARFGREPVLWASILVAGVSFMLVPLTTDTLLCGLLSALMGAGLGCGQPLSMTTTYNASPKHRTGEVLGLRMASNRLSQMIAPLFFGLVGAWTGIIAIFYVSGAFLIGGAFLTAGPGREQRAAPMNDSSNS